jgi:hypothetical protein
MTEPYKTKWVASCLTQLYDLLIMLSCLTLFGYLIFASIKFGGIWNKEFLLLYFPSILLIFHTIVVRVSRKEIVK